MNPLGAQSPPHPQEPVGRRAAGGRIVLAADITPWLRPDAATNPERLFRHVYGRRTGYHQTRV